MLDAAIVANEHRVLLLFLIQKQKPGFINNNVFIVAQPAVYVKACQRLMVVFVPTVTLLVPY